MGDDARIVIAIAGEDNAHRVLATRLLDAVLLERAQGGWPEIEELAQARVWRGWQEPPGEAQEVNHFYRTVSLEDDLQAVYGRRFLRTHRIHGQPAGEATWFIRLYELFEQRDPKVHALIGLRDTDGRRALTQDAQRATEYIQENLDPELRFVFGVAHREAEAWFVAGLGEVEPERLGIAREVLSFDPIQEPERLSSNPQAPTDAKRILRFLRGEGRIPGEVRSTPLSNQEYEEIASWRADVLSELESAVACGLADFIKSLRAEVAPRVLPGKR